MAVASCCYLRVNTTRHDMPDCMYVFDMIVYNIEDARSSE